MNILSRKQAAAKVAYLLLLRREQTVFPASNAGREFMLKSMKTYGIGVRELVRYFWRGVLNTDDFIGGITNQIVEGLQEAWYEGLSECGIAPNEMSNIELTALNEEIAAGIAAAPSFASTITEGSRAAGGLLKPLISRSDLWTNRYAAVKSRAQSLACGDQKLMWELGPTEDHCKDCSRMAGRVYRASVWNEWGVYPQHSLLECGGWRCKCRFVPTSEPITPGRPPSIG